MGKVAIPDHILLKPGKLTPEEFEIMKQHTVHGRDILARAERRLGGDSFVHLASDIAYSHHERWDGGGYPQGPASEAIPLAGRIMAVVDVYDALISKRVYKPPVPHAEAVSYVARNRGTHYDPAIVDVFLGNAERIREIALAYADCDLERVALAPVPAIPGP
ncbi:MAG: HD-GYP domain-containing protein [Solidesulfovibrio sp. DCME]|uniref:HD-GYP domain-containing protein n=1 Tax=Solidesulfovibrio sp. DCME TaxID=3447380 RepID=UPI003D12B045